MRDLTGMRFGRLVAVEPTERRAGTMVVWRCVCDCGRVAYAASSNLTRGRVRSCGCAAREARSSDLVGERFGKLTVVSRAGSDAQGRSLWRCVCDCDKVVTATTQALRRGKASCGCASSRRLDLAGRRFGLLTAVRQVGTRNRYALWECRCDCGNRREATSKALVSGQALSCGCRASCRAAESAIRAGGAKTGEKSA